VDLESKVSEFEDKLYES